MRMRLGLLWWLLVMAASVAGADTIKVKTEARAKGNLIILVSPPRVQIRPAQPDYGAILVSRLVVKKDIELRPDEPLSVDLGEVKPGERISAYLDGDANFMVTMSCGEGEWYSARPLRWVSSPTQAPVLHLDTRMKAYRPKLPAWMQERHLVSEKLMAAGCSPEEATVRFLVGLPPNYHQSRKHYGVLYVSSGFNGNRYSYLSRYRHLRNWMEKTGNSFILVSLDSSGRHGHHLFLDSELNGPRGQVLVHEVVPFVDDRYRTRPEAAGRAIYGQSSGAWTAISALRRHPETFGTALASNPDPLQLKEWWMPDSNNIYSTADGSPHYLTKGLTLRQFVELETQSGSAGQFSGFEACFGAPMFDPETGEVNPEIWAAWQDNDLYRWVEKHPQQAQESYHGRLHLFAGELDEFGLTPGAIAFSELLTSLGIEHQFELVKGGHHSDYVQRDPFLSSLWERAFKALY